jgi:hypothetical protein
MDRRIAHLDMDAFYASVELLRYPQLRGRPVVIGGRAALRSLPELQSGRFARLREYVGRGVVTTATYEARAYRVHSAMGLMIAAVLAPDAVLLPADFDRYRHYSRLFKDAVSAIASQIEDHGIDEIYIDLTAVPGDAVDLAHLSRHVPDRGASQVVSSKRTCYSSNMGSAPASTPTWRSGRCTLARLTRGNGKCRRGSLRLRQHDSPWRLDALCEPPDCGRHRAVSHPGVAEGSRRRALRKQRATDHGNQGPEPGHAPRGNHLPFC